MAGGMRSYRMARFLGTVKGGRGEAQRLGHATSGLHVEAGSWSGGVRVDMYDKDGEDYCNIQLIPWHGAGKSLQLYNGPAGGPPNVSDAEEALRCVTCVGFNKWKCRVHCEPAQDKQEQGE